MFLTRNGVRFRSFTAWVCPRPVLSTTKAATCAITPIPHSGDGMCLSLQTLPALWQQCGCVCRKCAKAIGRSVLLDDDGIKQKRVLTLFNNWGLSACMIERGHVLNGRDSLIGELGQMLINADDGAPQRLEKLMGREWVVGRLAHHPPASSSLLHGVSAEAITLSRVFAASAAGDPCAREIVGELAVPPRLCCTTPHFFSTLTLSSSWRFCLCRFFLRPHAQAAPGAAEHLSRPGSV